MSLGATDTYSAPFYDFLSDDAIYVGDDTGRLHQITGVFYGTTIGEASGWPVTLNASYPTASPVYDPTSGYVFVGNIAAGTNAALYAVNSSNASIQATSNGLGDAIVDGTLVDPSTEEVYAFVTTDGSGDNGVYQFAATFPSGTSGTEQQVGAGGAGYYLYSGDFDNVYYSSTTGPAGDLWVAGNTGSGTAGGTGVNLYRIPIGAGSTMGTPVAAKSNLTATAAGRYGWPSPITEFCNNGTSDCTANKNKTTAGTDYIFFSVDRLRTATANCGTQAGQGCVLAYSINTPTNAPTLVGSYQVSTTNEPGCWSTSAIEIDNSVPTGTLAGGSQIYTLEFNGNTAGGPTAGTYTSSACNTAVGDPSTPLALQLSQSALE